MSDSRRRYYAVKNKLRQLLPELWDECESRMINLSLMVSAIPKAKDLTQSAIAAEMKHPPFELQNIPKLLAEKYFCNFSLFQSLPDSWAFDQIVQGLGSLTHTEVGLLAMLPWLLARNARGGRLTSRSAWAVSAATFRWSRSQNCG